VYLLGERTSGKKNCYRILVLDRNDMEVTMDFEEKAELYTLLFTFRRKELKSEEGKCGFIRESTKEYLNASFTK
jgi:hypothetical protein